MKKYGLENLISQVRDNNNINYSFNVSNYKIIWYSDNIFRIKNYEVPVVYGFKGAGGRIKKWYSPFDDEEVIDLDIRKKTEYKIIKTVYGLANKNFNNQGSKLVTLTPAEKIIDVQEANKYFEKFIKRMKHHHGNFIYLAVIQFQDKKADNHRIHYHMLWDLPYIPQKELLEIWGHGLGSVDIRKIYSVDNLGAYLLRYMGKSVGDARLYGNKAYLCSKGLKRPLEKFLTDDEFKEIYKKYDLKNRKSSIKPKGYQTENYGWVTENEYNLKRAY